MPSAVGNADYLLIRMIDASRPRTVKHWVKHDYPATSGVVVLHVSPFHQ